MWPHMRAQGYGRILNVCSVDGVLLGNHGYSVYDAAKGGLSGLTRGLAIEGAPLGIVVNGLLPGALTRGQATVDPTMSPRGQIDMRPSLVAPAACWLVHEEMRVHGRFFISSSGRMGEVYTSVAEGYQSSNPDTFDLEEVRSNWEQVCARHPAIVPATVAEFNQFRIDIFNRDVRPRSAAKPTRTSS
jgi:NAD(P)-dependent dehydrogenase (short-subunit alcohol dehydrogenase family)